MERNGGMRRKRRREGGGRKRNYSGCSSPYGFGFNRPLGMTSEMVNF